MNTIPDLHDATLESITLDWVTGKMRITFRTATGALLLELKDVTHAVCPRHLPWGPSHSVNEVQVKRTPHGQHLSIEMQSGDVLEVDGCEALVV